MCGSDWRQSLVDAADGAPIVVVGALGRTDVGVLVVGVLVVAEVVVPLSGWLFGSIGACTHALSVF